MIDQLEHSMAEADEDDVVDEMEIDFDKTDFVELNDKYSSQDSLPASTDNPIDDVDDRQNERYCRICLQSDPLGMCENLVSLFSSLNGNIRINEALAICFGLEIFQEQDLSIGNEICLECMKKLQVTYDFRKLCLASQYELKSTHLDKRIVEANAENFHRVSTNTVFII